MIDRPVEAGRVAGSVGGPARQRRQDTASVGEQDP